MLEFKPEGSCAVILQEGAAEVAVDEANLGEYISSVTDATLGSGIAAQVASFKEGFEQVSKLEVLGKVCALSALAPSFMRLAGGS